LEYVGLCQQKYSSIIDRTWGSFDRERGEASSGAGADIGLF